MDRALDALSSRAGVTLVLALLCAMCAAVGLYLQAVVKQLEETHAVFEDRQVRNGYVALSDIQRLLKVSQQAATLGEMTPELANQFVFAADIVYVRMDHLETIMNDDIALPSGLASIDALSDVILIADDAVQSGFHDPTALYTSLVDASDEARKRLVQFLDDMRLQADQVLADQSKVVVTQRAVVLFNLVGLSLVGGVALMLLRREVHGRRERERVEKHVSFLAYFDPLTELPNRVQFQERLQVILDRGNPTALLLIDLDDFKLINDTYGHASGDAVLKSVATSLAEFSAGADGFAARLAGDEFAMIVGTTNRQRLIGLCREILQKTAAPVSFEGETIDVSLSIGIATSTEVGSGIALSMDGISRVADFALYASKSRGRRRFTFYDRDLEKQFLERRKMLEELPRAIEEGLLETFMQPKIDLRSGRVYGFEALVRWRRNGHLVSPAEFITIAEESGLVVDIDTYVLNQATKVIADWNRAHGTRFSISVNLSALQFSSRKVLDAVNEAIWRSELPPDLLTLEITETMAVHDWETAQKTITTLKKLGCKIAIDDFGTGFSTFAYLRSTLADELKIDRSLVEELESSDKARVVLNSVFDIARNLDLVVVVEGIETTEQAEIVRGMGAPFAQGFLYGKPMAHADVLQKAMEINGRRAAV